MLGGVGAGKSHVARRAAELGRGAVIDADALAHEALRLYAGDGRLAAAVGDEFVREGRPDIGRLGARAFAEAPFLEKLERLLHPYVHAHIKAAVDAHRSGDGADLLVLDVALLVEAGSDRMCDALWYVDVPDALRGERAAKRGLTMEEIRLRETFQTPVERKRARADLVIHNDVDDDALDQQVIEGLEALGVRVPLSAAVRHDDASPDVPTEDEGP